MLQNTLSYGKDTKKKKLPGLLLPILLQRPYGISNKVQLKIIKFYVLYTRLFEHPCPPQRILLDAVSKFTADVHHSLQAGSLRRRTITLEFPRHVFNYLFNNKGSNVPGRSGRLYNRGDFHPQYFDDNSFVHYNKHGEGCMVKFPIYMYSYVRFCPQSYDHTHQPLPRTFTERLTINIVKCHC